MVTKYFQFIQCIDTHYIHVAIPKILGLEDDGKITAFEHAQATNRSYKTALFTAYTQGHTD